MKKKILSLIFVFLAAVVCFAGCGLGSYVDNGNKNPPSSVEPENPSENPNPSDDPEAEDTHYRVKVYLGNSPFYPGDSVINVVWKSDFNIVSEELGADGTADAGELDGDYAVYLEGLPAIYSYDPSKYTASDTVTETDLGVENNRHVTILLTTIHEPETGNGKGLYINNGCYNVKYDGTYRATVAKENDVVYYEYTPTAAGIYSIVSLVNVYADEVNPYIDVYVGTIGWKMFNYTLDGGGFSLSGGFTKNFRYEVRIDETEVGGSFTFAIRAASKTNEYPVTVDFAITFEGNYKSENTDIRTIRAEEARFKAPEPKPGQTFTFADLGTKRFDGNNYKYNDKTGYYHYYNAEKYADNPYGYGAGFGPILYCNITGAVPSYTVMQSLYNADAVGGGGIAFNYLKLYNVWIEAEQKYAVYDYTEFIKTDYRNVCNSDGVCYVTPELKTFLQKFVENHSLYTDGMTSLDGTPEALGYTANQAGLWLFACGIYVYEDEI